MERSPNERLRLMASPASCPRKRRRSPRCCGITATRHSAFGKWHNTPATETTSMGPFDRWPTGYGFDHFWGFIAGETSQWEPRLTHNTTHIEPPNDGKLSPD